MEELKNSILESVKLRPGISNNSDELLTDIIGDTLNDVSSFLNLKQDDEFPKKCVSIVKDIVILKCNRLGTEGLSSQSASGVSESYIDGMPKDVKAKLKRFRKLP